uniref:CG12084_1 protein n=1 Tax=Fopius arisanus TaxID=64838 RepID=A0A0C9QA43_9HYME
MEIMAHLDLIFSSKQYVGPESLADLCFRAICDNLDIISTRGRRGYRTLNKGLVFPSEICDKLVEFAQKNDKIEVDDRFFHIFQDVVATRLRRVSICHSAITDTSIAAITKHQVTHLAFEDCGLISKLGIEDINANAKNLQSLAFRGCPRLALVDLTIYLDSALDYVKRGYVFRAPNLKHFAFEHVEIAPAQYTLLLGSLTNLTHLDLSNATKIGSLEFHTVVPHLVSLCLYNVRIIDFKAFVENVIKLKGLRHLDLSQSNNKQGSYKNPNQVLSKLVSGLPNLVSLDIGGTNLAGRGVAERSVDDENVEYGLCDIQGLACRVNNPLQFLGLYGTREGACRRHDIPAKVIAGDANDEQILIAARVSMNHKPELLQKVLNDLYHVFRYESCERMDQALCIVLEAMEKHIAEKHIQISGSATLFYIVKTKEKK